MTAIQGAARDYEDLEHVDVGGWAVRRYKIMADGRRRGASDLISNAMVDAKKLSRQYENVEIWGGDPLHMISWFWKGKLVYYENAVVFCAITDKNTHFRRFQALDEE